MCNATHFEARSKSTATLASLSEDGCPDAKATTPSTAAMDNHHSQAPRSPSDEATVAPDDHSAGDKRRRHLHEEVQEWEPGMGLRLDDDADFYPQSRLARLEATSLLFERLVQQAAIIRAHVIKRRRQDQIERGISRKIAERHPLRPHAESPARPRAKSIPCELASPPLGAFADASAPLCAKSVNCPGLASTPYKVVVGQVLRARFCGPRLDAARSV